MPTPVTVDEAVAKACDCEPATTRWCVAFSGGLDSTVLLHALQRAAPGRVRALHVAHGLQPDIADVWSDHIRQVCQAMDVPLNCVEANLDRRGGESVEALARQARYRLLAHALEPGEVLTTAQHADDQAETLLLQLMRGAGPEGLASMPARARFGEGVLVRPLLSVARASIQSYALREGLRWFDDPTNLDTAIDRNFMRLEVIPRLRERWPAVTETLNRAAKWQQQVSRVARSEGAHDWHVACGVSRDVASCVGLGRLSDERLRLALRAGIRASGFEQPNETRLETLVALVRNTSGRGSIVWGAVGAYRYRDRLFLLPNPPPIPTAFSEVWDGSDSLSLPEGFGQLTLTGSAIGALDWRVHFREPGLIVVKSDGQTQSFARWCQSLGVPPWARERLPMLSIGDHLVAIGAKRLALWPQSASKVGIEWSGAPSLGLSGTRASGIV